MILSRTPLRISFAGGLSDLECYYKNHTGRVISTSIDKYIYICVNKRFLDEYKVSYLDTEIVNKIRDIKHPLIRECLKKINCKDYLEIISLSDVPGSTGLGSSSSYTVGLLKALYKLYDTEHTQYTLAEDASDIEINILKNPIGKQDQIAASFGGFNTIIFKKTGVEVTPLNIESKVLDSLQNNLMLFYTNKTRESKSILKEQKSNISNISSQIKELTVISKQMEDDLLYNNGNDFGYLLGKEWTIKQNTGNVSTDEIDSYISNLYNLGIDGVKNCGAGKGGFLLVYCKPQYQSKVKESIGLKELKFKFEQCGSRIMYDNSKELI